jgi:hypothetical protein
VTRTVEGNQPLELANVVKVFLLTGLLELFFSRVQSVDVALVVLVVMKPHRLLVDVRLQRVVCVREIRKRMFTLIRHRHTSVSGRYETTR